MKDYTLHEARADFSRLVDRALDGEPQRVIKRGKPAVVVISEAEWLGKTRGRPTLTAALKAFSLAGGLHKEE